MLLCAFAPFASNDTLPPLLRLLGRFHPALVHFPIALLAVAAALETWQIIRRRPTLAAATPTCLILGGLSAVAASVLGWLLDDGTGGDLVVLHQWIGFATTIIAVAAAALVLAPRLPRARLAVRPLLLLAATLAGGAGYLGGELVFGRNHLFKGVFDDAPSNPSPLARDSGRGAAELSRSAHATTVAADDEVDFNRDVFPTLKDRCFRCHGGDKTKGKLSLLNLGAALKGGKSGASLVPGKAEQSKLYTSLVEADSDVHMPPPREKQLSQEQIATIRKWIEQGAAWPETAASR